MSAMTPAEQRGERPVTLKTHVARLENKVEDLETLIRTQNNEIRDLLVAWRTATAVVVFIKWAAAIGAAFAGLKAGWDQFKALAR